MGSWQPVGTGIWSRGYLFGGNPINTYAVDMGDGGLMVISPGTDVAEEAYVALDAIGTVQALVSPGAFHHMGLPSWSARYPEAGLYGPTSAIAHIAGQHAGLRALQPLDALGARLEGDHVLEEVAGCKHPDVFLALRRDDGTTWFTNEVLSNNGDYPAGFFLRWAFKLTGNHPGLNVNTLACMLIRAKKPRVRAYYEAKLQEVPPTRLAPSHGTILEGDTVKDRIAEVLARRL